MSRRWASAWLRHVGVAKRTGLAALALLGGVSIGLAAPTTGDPVAGKTLFGANCAGCHTLSAAGATGEEGPNLDTRKPAFATVQRQVTRGGGGMPGFSTSLAESQIADISAFVSQATGGSPPTPTPGPTPTPTPPPAPDPAPVPPPAALPTATAVTFSASRLALSVKTLKAGRVTLTLRNRTNRPVRLAVTVRPGRIVTRALAPNATRAVTVILAAGQRRVTVGPRSVAIVAETPQ